MSVKDGLLALLAAGPSHGYQLRSDFQDATGNAWQLNIGQVYTSLQRLERDGLVTETTQPAEDEERRVFALTAEGREHLAAWLAQPVQRTLSDRDEVTMKILLAVAAPGSVAQTVISVQRDTTITTLQGLTRRKGKPGASLADRVHLDRLILSCRAEVDWLDLVEQRIYEHLSTTNGTRA